MLVSNSTKRNTIFQGPLQKDIPVYNAATTQRVYTQVLLRFGWKPSVNSGVTYSQPLERREAHTQRHAGLICRSLFAPMVIVMGVGVCMRLGQNIHFNQIRGQNLIFQHVFYCNRVFWLQLLNEFMYVSVYVYEYDTFHPLPASPFGKADCRRVPFE